MDEGVEPHASANAIPQLHRHGKLTLRPNWYPCGAQPTQSARLPETFSEAVSNIPPGVGPIDDAEVERLRERVVSILRAGVDHVLRYETLRAKLVEAQTDVATTGRTFVIALGKAALSMSDVVAEHISRVESATFVVPHGYRAAWDAPVPWGSRATLLEAGHPLPDDTSADAAAFLEHLLADTTADDRVVVLVSGGGSALVAAPIPGMSEVVFRKALADLYVSGRPIGEVNLIRRGICRLAGGGLARAAHPTRVSSLILSDVPDDDPCMVASGPTCLPTPADIATTRSLVELTLGEDVGRLVDTAMSGRTPADRDLVSNMLVGSNADAVAGLLQACAEAGIRVRATRRMVGEARTVGARLTAEADRALSAGEALVFGGETTVTVRGAGRGGRCQELVVAAADALERGGRRAIVGCLGTDGRDGPNGAAGAVAAVVPGTTRWQMTAPTALANNDTFPLLEEAGALVHTGPTHTNVMDIGVLVMIS